MERAEIKQIADYIKDLEEGLIEGDYQGLPEVRDLDELKLQVGMTKQDVIALLGESQCKIGPGTTEIDGKNVVFLREQLLDAHASFRFSQRLIADSGLYLPSI